MRIRILDAAVLAVGTALVAACSSGSVPQGVMPQPGAPSGMTQSQTAQVQTAYGMSVLGMLSREQTIGSDVDPVTGDVNPYGLDVAKVSSGKIQAGDLVVCDFNDAANVQGTGTAIVALHPAVGAKPLHIASSSSLDGCNAIAMAPNGTIWAAAFSANDNPVVSSSGQVLTTLSQVEWFHPFGEAFVPPVNVHSVPAFYVSNAANGTIMRVFVFPGPQFRFVTIASGFPVNHGVPGSILSPSGLNYQPLGDRLYVVDGTNNALYAIDHISQIEAHGITVNGFTFSGKFAADAHVVFHGAPLNGPISSAVLFNGNIVLGNTLDANGKNLMIEISPAGAVLNVKNVDTGAAGALFGMVATGTSPATTRLYFNDDNDNTLKVLSE